MGPAGTVPGTPAAVECRLDARRPLSQSPSSLPVGFPTPHQATRGRPRCASQQSTIAHALHACARLCRTWCVVQPPPAPPPTPPAARPAAAAGRRPAAPPGCPRRPGPGPAWCSPAARGRRRCAPRTCTARKDAQVQDGWMFLLLCRQAPHVQPTVQTHVHLLNIQHERRRWLEAVPRALAHSVTQGHTAHRRKCTSTCAPTCAARPPAPWQQGMAPSQQPPRLRSPTDSATEEGRQRAASRLQGEGQ